MDDENIGIDRESLIAGITKLKNLLSELCQEKKMLVKQREDALGIVKQLLIKFKNAILDGSCRDILTVSDLTNCLYQDVIKEAKGNTNKAVHLIKDGSFNNFVLFASELADPCRQELLESNDIQLLEMLLKLLCNELVNTQSWMEDSLARVLNKCISHANMSNLNSNLVRGIWSRVVRLIQRNSGSMVVYCMQIAITLLRTSRKTILFLAGKDLVEDLLKAVNEAEIQPNSINKEHFRWMLELFTQCIEEYGVECRKTILDAALPYGEHISHSIQLDSNEENDVCWRFMDRICQLAMPDSFSSALTDARIYSIAFETLRCSLKSFLSVSVNRATFIVPKENLNLIARLLVMCELSPEGNAVSLDQSLAHHRSMTTQGTPAKRRKEVSILQSLINWDFEYAGRSLDPVQWPNIVCSCLLILDTAVRNWSHRLGKIRLESIAQEIWKQHSRTSDAHRNHFCTLLSSLVDLGVLGADSIQVKTEAAAPSSDPMQDPRVRIAAIWKYAVTSSHVDDACNSALRLMVAIIKRFKEIVGNDGSIVESLLAIISHNCSSSSLNALLFMLGSLEFDERSSFPGIAEKSSGIVHWRLRCQLADWLVQKSTEDIASHLYQLCLYHPHEVKQTPDRETLSFGLDNSLRKFGLIRDCCSLFPSTSTLSVVRFPQTSNPFGDLLISDVIEYILNLLSDAWFQRSSDREKVVLCNLILRFSHMLSSNEKRAPSHNPFDAIMISCSEWIVNICSLDNDQSNHILEALDPSPAGYDAEISAAARKALIARSSGSPVLLARFGAGDEDIPPQSFLIYMAEVVLLLQTGTAPQSLRREAGIQMERFLKDVNFLPDMILLIEKFGHVMEQCVRNAMIERARQIAQDDTYQDELDSRLAILCIRELEIDLNLSIHVAKLPVEKLEALPMAMAIKHMDSINLNLKIVGNLFTSSLNSHIMLQSVVRHIFSCSNVWPLFSKIIAHVIREEKFFNICFDYVPKLDDLVDFYIVSMSLDQITSEIPQIQRCLLSYQNGSLAKSVAENVNFSAADFPDVYYLDSCHWPNVAKSFWKLYSNCACSLLTSLRSLAASHLNLGLEHRLLKFLLVLSVGSPEMNDRMRKPFDTIVRALMMQILKTAVQRKYSESVMEDIFELCRDVCKGLKDAAMCAAFLIDVWSPTYDSVESSRLKEKLHTHIKKEVFLLMTKGVTEDIAVFTLRSFWDCLLKRLTKRREFIIEARKRGNYLFDQLLFAWEMVPHVRPLLAQLMLLFDEECLKKPLFHNKTSSKSFLSRLADYCQLQLASYWEAVNSEIILCCLQTLSSNSFGERAILCGQEIHSSAARSDPAPTDLVVDLCQNLLKTVSEHLRGQSESQPLLVLREFLHKMPALCHMLAPSLCATEAGVNCAKVILEFGIERLEYVDPSDRHVIRLARTLCECVDSVGLNRWSAISCSSTEIFIIARTIENCGYHEHAYALANLAYDRLVVKCRNRIGFGGRVPENKQLTELLQDIYVNSNNVNATKSLPGWAQVNAKVQHLKSVAENKWLQLSCDSLSTSEDIALARFFCGSGASSCDLDADYLVAVVSSDWMQTNVSYPKKLKGKWSRIYASILHVIALRDVEMLIPLRRSLLLKLSSLDVVELASQASSLIEELHDFELLYNFGAGTFTRELLEQTKPLNLLTLVSYCYRETTTASQTSVFSQSIGSLTESQSATVAETTALVVQICNQKLLDIQAFSACLHLLNLWQTVQASASHSSSNRRLSDRVKIEKCRVMIATGEYQMAHYHLTTMTETDLQYEIAVDAICLLADIHVDHMQQLDSAVVLVSDLVTKLSDEMPSENATRAVQQLHSLAHRQLTELEAYITTPSFTTRLDAVKKWDAQKPKEKIQKTTDMSSEERRRLTIISRELDCEQREITKVRKQLSDAAHLTVKSGLLLLKYVGPADSSLAPTELESEKGIRVIFPLLDVIFRYEREKRVIEELRKYILGMTPSLWVPVLAHIISHCFAESPISFVIQDLVTRLLVAYPYHVLPTLLSYKFDGTLLHKKLSGHKTKADNFKHRRSAMDPGPLKFEDSEFDVRSKFANRVDALISASERQVPVATRNAFNQIVFGMNLAETLYRQFVWLRTDSEQYFTRTSKGYKMSNCINIISNIDFLSTIPIPAIDQRLGRAGDYTGCGLVTWAEIDTLCDKADGQSAPKIIKIKGSDGKWYKSVWKHGEDVRQDSLVQQFFGVMSGLLNTRQPLRTYNVLPLDGFSGVIEFCENTSALKDILVGSDMKGGLHNEMYPAENVNDVRIELTALQRNSDFTEELFQREVLDKITPVFRHYFYKKFPSVIQWSETIDNYMLSLAEWSIVCYVVGLGDRHTSNVLFDEQCCNFVHIDLGMILEYGKRTLPIPERVPFRLTRDLLDPILIQGHSGALHSYCSTALDNLRKNKQIIFGMASVFLRETMANFRDSNDATQPSHISATAISRLRDKLNGTDATISPVYANIQAQRLLAEATNVEHVSTLFSGWASFL